MNILFVTASRVGDAVLSSGVLDHLVRTHPGARVWVACGAAPAPLFTATPAVERVIAIAKRRWAGHWFELWRATVGIVWDLVVDLRSWALAWTLPARRRLVLRKRDDRVHRVRQYGAVLGLEPPPAPYIRLDEAHRRRAAALAPAGLPILALGATANWGGKQWPADRFAALADRLTAPGAPLAGAAIAVMGAANERPGVTALIEQIPPARRIDLVGTADLLTIAALCERARLFVGNDSGLMHLAAAMATPTLGLFGPSRESLYAPWGAHTATVRTPEIYDAIVTAPDYDYRDQRSRMTSLAVETAVAAALDLLARQGPRP